jgi:hypothetical protein
MSTEYNGWSNVETWRVQLNLQNNVELYAAATAMAFNALAVAERDKTHDADRVLSLRLRDYVTDEMHGRLGSGAGDGVETLVWDTVDASLGRVDWEQLARHWIVSVHQSRCGNLA